MTYFIAGSTAIDQLMTFPGKFSDSLLPDKLERVSLSFLIDRMSVVYGGVAANIAYGLGILGLKPVLISAVGKDFSDYRTWLEKHGVDTSLVYVSSMAHTAHFVCTTDEALAQIASFYPGAMEESKNIDLSQLIIQHRPRGVLIGAGEPYAMVKHTIEAHACGVPVYADPSQQLPRLSSEQVITLIKDATILFCNDYEWELMQTKTGLSAQELTAYVRVRITTLGENGVEVVTCQENHQDSWIVPALTPPTIVDPTGVGDGFRAGFLAAYAQELPLKDCVQFGQLVAVHVLENNGTQGWTLSKEHARDRYIAAYGSDNTDYVFSVLFP